MLIALAQPQNKHHKTLLGEYNTLYYIFSSKGQLGVPVVFVSADATISTHYS